MARKLFCSFLLSLLSQPVLACTLCNRMVREKLFDSSFLPNLLLMLSPFIVLGIVVGVLLGLAGHRWRGYRSPLPTLGAALVLGIGLGGFVDGIVLHQILQWHEMVSNRLPPVDYVSKSVNMFWDGIFHAFCLIVVLAGIIRLWSLMRRPDIDASRRLLVGGLLGGWGLFNIIEGILDHHVMKLHNVREQSDHPELWNLGFLGFSLLLLVIAGAIAAPRFRRIHSRRSSV